MTSTGIALILYVGWTMVLLIVMEGVRSSLVLRGKIASNAFLPGNENLSPFMQRIARAHMNCVESFPVLGGLLIAALATGNSAVTDGLAYWMIAARVVQSSIHLASLSPMAVNARFAAFCVQIVIALIWLIGLLSRAF